MTGAAFEVLSQKRKRIASELAELETKVRAVGSLIENRERPGLLLTAVPPPLRRYMR